MSKYNIISYTLYCIVCFSVPALPILYIAYPVSTNYITYTISLLYAKYQNVSTNIRIFNSY